MEHSKSEEWVLLRFAETLDDGFYRIVLTSGIQGDDGSSSATESLSFSSSVDGSDFQEVLFEVELGPQVVAVVPTPVTITGSTLDVADNAIDVYFDSADLFEVGSNVGIGCPVF
ncbi:unnamed protein product, partial [Hapterophycus canaliculatus]